MVWLVGFVALKGVLGEADCEISKSANVHINGFQISRMTYLDTAQISHTGTNLISNSLNNIGRIQSGGGIKGGIQPVCGV